MDTRSDDDFDELLRSAAPRTAAPSPQLTAILDDLITDTMRESRPAGRDVKRRRRMGLVAAAIVTVTGVGMGAAAASGVFSPSPKTSNWFDEVGVVRNPMTFSSGHSCDLTVAPVPLETATDAGARWDQAMTAAHTFMKSVDPASFSVPDAVAAYRASATKARLARQSADDIKITAVTVQIGAGMDAALRKQNLPADAVTIATSDTCETTK